VVAALHHATRFAEDARVHTRTLSRHTFLGAVSVGLALLVLSCSQPEDADTHDTGNADDSCGPVQAALDADKEPLLGPPEPQTTRLTPDLNQDGVADQLLSNTLCEGKAPCSCDGRTNCVWMVYSMSADGCATSLGEVRSMPDLEVLDEISSGFRVLKAKSGFSGGSGEAYLEVRNGEYEARAMKECGPNVGGQEPDGCQCFDAQFEPVPCSQVGL
jgi:hypothetical protein